MMMDQQLLLVQQLWGYVQQMHTANLKQPTSRRPALVGFLFFEPIFMPCFFVVKLKYV